MNRLSRSELVYEFGPFRLDVAERLLLRNGEAVPLTPKAFDTLLVLLRNKGRVVEKEELLKTVWPDTFVEEGILAVNVSTLRKALGEDESGRGYLETVPRRGYRFVGAVQETGTRKKKSWWNRPIIAASCSAVLLLAVFGWNWLRPRPERDISRVVPLTTYAGSEESPTFSPDGSQFAFSWNGERQNNFDIYIRLVSGGSPVRLTTDAADDILPAWSPDGNWIAFLRDGAVMLVSPLGGADRKLVDTRATDLTWAPDSKSLAISCGRDGIYRVFPDTLEKERLTTPAATDFGDSSSGFTPDGRSLVFARLPSASSTDLYLLALGGKPIPLLQGGSRISSLVTVPNSQEVIYAMGGLGLASRHQRPIGETGRLWRMSIAGRTKEPEPVAGVPEGVGAPAILRRAGSGQMALAFEKRLFDVNIWWMAPGGIPAPRALINSTRVDSNPQFSPDGKRIAFSSDRSGSLEIWVCNSDGTNATKLTAFSADMVHAPRWSTDGRRIAFSVLSRGNRDVYYVDADGGVAKRLTSDATQEGRPSWSRDGRWIYYYSTRSGSMQVWKHSLADGQTVQVTRAGGHEAFESPDGKLLLYTRPDRAGVWAVPVDGAVEESKETKLLDHVRESTWAVANDGIYFVDFQSDSRSERPLSFYEFSTRRVRKVGLIPGEIGRVTPSLSVRTDGSAVLWAQIDRAESDLMVIENFR